MSSGLKKTKSGKEKKTSAPEKADEGAKDRYAKLIEAAADKAPEKIQPFIKQAAPVVATAIVFAEAALPHVIKFVTLASEMIAKLPENVLYSIVGLCICFFGGVFPATIAAFEAWRLCGGEEAIAHVKQIWCELSKVKAASAEDDEKDEDGDGVADVNQIEAKELLMRKVGLAVKTVDPQSLNNAVVGIYTGWIGVLAVLKIQFAKTVTLGEVIGTKMYGIASHSEPLLKSMCAEEYQKWVPMAVRWVCKGVAITLAWWIQRVISAFHSAIRGGFMCSQYLVEYLKEKKLVKLDEMLGGYADEAVGWSIALLGLLFQWSFGFGVPFPLNLLTWPLNIIEAFIVWSVSSS